MGADQTGDTAMAASSTEPGNVVSPDNQNRVLVVGAGVLAAIALGWFVLSHVVLGTRTVDALWEAMGVVLALLIVGSVVGAVRANRRNSS